MNITLILSNGLIVIQFLRALVDRLRGGRRRISKPRGAAHEMGCRGTILEVRIPPRVASHVEVPRALDSKTVLLTKDSIFDMLPQKVPGTKVVEVRTRVAREAAPQSGEFDSSRAASSPALPAPRLSSVPSVPHDHRVADKHLSSTVPEAGHPRESSRASIPIRAYRQSNIRSHCRVASDHSATREFCQLCDTIAKPRLTAN